MDMKAEKEQIVANTVNDIRDFFSLYEPSFHSTFDNLYHSPSDVLFTNKRKMVIGFAIENPDKNETIFVKMKGQELKPDRVIGCETAFFGSSLKSEDADTFLWHQQKLLNTNMKLDSSLLYPALQEFRDKTIVRFDKQGKISKLTHNSTSVALHSFILKNEKIECKIGYNSHENIGMSGFPISRYREFSLPVIIDANKQLVRKENSFGNPPLQTEIKNILEKLPFEPSK